MEGRADGRARAGGQGQGGRGRGAGGQGQGARGPEGQGAAHTCRSSRDTSASRVLAPGEMPLVAAWNDSSNELPRMHTQSATGLPLCSGLPGLLSLAKMGIHKSISAYSPLGCLTQGSAKHRASSTNA